MRILCRNAETLSFIDLKEDAWKALEAWTSGAVFVQSLATLIFTDPIFLSISLSLEYCKNKIQQLADCTEHFLSRNI